MPHLSPPTLTASEQAAILAATAVNPRDHFTFSLGTSETFRPGLGW